jgi:LDH2 family malate/lactate/ureidoglycolate dehydrogenase
VAECLCKANARGIPTHGVYLLVPIWQRIQAGQLSLPTRVQTVSDSGGTAVIDGGDGLGAVAAMAAVDIAIDKARQFGVSTVLIRNTNNIGSLACYTEMAARKGMIALMGSNAAPAMAPWGGAEAFLGTNPIAIAIYTGENNVFSADMAMSVVARGKIRQAERRGESIPDNWATDDQGQATTDPRAALKGTLLPIGGPKGSAIALAVDIVSGMLSGSQYGPGIKSFHTTGGKTGVGVFLLVIDISHFMEPVVFQVLMDSYIEKIKGLKKAAGFDRILLPGECEFSREQQGYRDGIELDDNTVLEIDRILESIGSEIRLRS